MDVYRIAGRSVDEQLNYMMRGMSAMQEHELMCANKRALQNAAECFNDPQRRNEYLALFDKNVKIHIPGDWAQGYEGLCRYYDQLWRAVPDATISIDDMIVESNRVAVRVTMRGTHKGDEFPPFGVKATHKRLELSRMATFSFDKNSKCTELWVVWDNLDLLRQLGVEQFPIAAAATTKTTTTETATSSKQKKEQQQQQLPQKQQQPQQA